MVVLSKTDIDEGLNISSSTNKSKKARSWSNSNDSDRIEPPINKKRKKRGYSHNELDSSLSRLNISSMSTVSNSTNNRNKEPSHLDSYSENLDFDESREEIEIENINSGREYFVKSKKLKQ